MAPPSWQSQYSNSSSLVPGVLATTQCFPWLCMGKNKVWVVLKVNNNKYHWLATMDITPLWFSQQMKQAHFSREGKWKVLELELSSILSLVRKRSRVHNCPVCPVFMHLTSRLCWLSSTAEPWGVTDSFVHSHFFWRGLYISLSESLHCRMIPAPVPPLAPSPW